MRSRHRGPPGEGPGVPPARAFCASAAVGIAALPGSALAVPLAFPTDQTLIPFAVGAAFALPAVLALGYGLAARLARRIGTLGGLCALSIITIAVVGYWQPGWILTLAARG